jgi:hypothetical protein
VQELPSQNLLFYIVTLIAPKGVIPAKAGIQEKTGFRVKPGMTDGIRLISLCMFMLGSIRTVLCDLLIDGRIEDSHIQFFFEIPLLGGPVAAGNDA